MKHFDIPQDRLADFCRKHRIRKLSLFGSVLRDDFRPDSDIDVLVDFEPDGGPSFFELIRMEDEFSAFFDGHPVEIVKEKYLSEFIKDEVLAEAELQYAQA